MNAHCKRSAWKLWEFIGYILLLFVGYYLVILFGVWWFSMLHIPQTFSGSMHVLDFALFLLLTYVVWYQIMNELFVWTTALFASHPVPMNPRRGLRVALATAFVPGKEPYDVLENTLHAMVAVVYPHDTWVLDEGDDKRVKQLCKTYKVKHFSRHGISAYNTNGGKFAARTKAGNYNAWFNEHGNNYDIVAQHDVDFIPNRDYLIKTLGYFNDPNVAFVGSPQIYGNTDESWIARGAAEQGYGFYGVLQKGLFGQNMQLFIGANHVIRTAAHNDIAGYSGHIVEDHLTGMRLYAKRWKSVYVPEVLLVGEGPATWDAYFSQQMRWAYGLIDILFSHTPRLVKTMRWHHSFNYILLQQYYFFGLAQVVGLLLLVIYFFFGIEATGMSLHKLLMVYPPVLIIQIIIYLYLQRLYIRPKEESGFHLYGKILNIAAWPVYVWAFISVIYGNKLTYQVTPKGSMQTSKADIGLFVLHGIIGTISAVSILVSLWTGNDVPQLIFWASITTISMYFFVLHAAWNHIQRVSSYLNSCLIVLLTLWGGTVCMLAFSSVQRILIKTTYLLIFTTGYRFLFY